MTSPPEALPTRADWVRYYAWLVAMRNTLYMAQRLYPGDENEELLAVERVLDCEIEKAKDVAWPGE